MLCNTKHIARIANPRDVPFITILLARICNPCQNLITH